MDVARLQRLIRAIDRVVHLFKINPRLGEHLDDPYLLLRSHESRHGDQVRVELLRSVGWSYDRIFRSYRIPIRTAQQWQQHKKGKRLLDFAVSTGRIEADLLVRILTGLR